jgi:hypothetical protein
MRHWRDTAKIRPPMVVVNRSCELSEVRAKNTVQCSRRRRRTAITAKVRPEAGRSRPQCLDGLVFGRRFG